MFVKNYDQIIPLNLPITTIINYLYILSYSMGDKFTL